MSLNVFLKSIPKLSGNMSASPVHSAQNIHNNDNEDLSFYVSLK